MMEMSGFRAVWPGVLAVYAVKITTKPDNAQEVATMDDLIAACNGAPALFRGAPTERNGLRTEGNGRTDLPSQFPVRLFSSIGRVMVKQITLELLRKSRMGQSIP